MNYPLPRRLQVDPDWYAAWGGGETPEPPHTLRCYLFGCKVPDARVRERWRSSDGKESGGTAYAIRCQRCDREIAPMDRDYPPIR